VLIIRFGAVAASRYDASSTKMMRLIAACCLRSSIFCIVIIGSGTTGILQFIAPSYGSIFAACFLHVFFLQHLLAFLFAELGTSGAIDGNNQLIMKGRFQQKHIENVLRRYIKEYVTCHTCRSPDTILNKETRLFFLQVSN
jgi:translation initiation factor 2 beta subunit (eIF-2beta)/eIF-5